APPLPPPVAERAPADLRALIGRLLEKEPSARLASAAEVIAVLDGCIAALAPTKPAPAIVAMRAEATGAPAPAAGAGADVGERLRGLEGWLRARALDGAARALDMAKRRPKAAIAAAIGVGGIGVAAILLCLIALIRKAPSRVATAPATNVVSPATRQSALS